MKLLRSRKLIISVSFATLLLISWAKYTYGSCTKWWYGIRYQCDGIDDTCPSCVRSHTFDQHNCTEIEVTDYANNVTRCELAVPPAGWDNCNDEYDLVVCRREGVCLTERVKGGKCFLFARMCRLGY